MVFFKFTAFVINAGVDEIGKYIIAVGCANKLMYRQTHHFGIIACQNIAEVACRYGKVNFVTGFNAPCCYCIAVCAEIINNLRYKAAPVNGVGRA